MTLLSALEPVEHHRLDDAVRDIAWSPTGRCLALGGNGRALFTGDGRLTAPIGPDPIGCAWITVERVAVVDGVMGVVLAGGGSVDVLPPTGAIGVAAPIAGAGDGASDAPPHERCGVAVGAAGVTVVYARPGATRAPTTIDTGPVRLAAHLGGAIWIAGGAEGLVVVDVALGCVDQRVELPGVVSLATSVESGRVAAADSTGAIHVLHISDLGAGTTVTGYPDAVRHLTISPLGDMVVAGADDELTWWRVDDAGRVADSPQTSVGHVSAITTCTMGATGFVATGDRDGVVRLWSPQLHDLPIATMHVDSEVTALAWSPWGDRLAVGSANGEVVVADISAGELL